MKALVIAPQPFFTPRGTPFSIYYRTLISSELGVKIDLLTYGEGQDVEIPNVNFIRIPRFKFLGNAKVGPSGLKLFLDIFIFFKMMALLLSNKYDYVHAHEEAVFFAFFLKPLFRYKLVYDMHSSLPQQLTNFNFTTSKFLINVFKKLENACLRSSSAVITICPDLYFYVDSVITKKEKHFLIENSIFDKVVLKSNNKIDIDSTGDHILKIPEDKKVILYAGTLESYQGIDILIRSFAYVIEKELNVLLLIVGGTPEQVKNFSKLVEELKIGNNIIFTGRVPQSIAKQYTCHADVLVSPRSAGTNTPLKIYEQLASGIPLVATNIYSHTQVLTDDTAFLVDPVPEKLAEGLISALCSNGLAKQKSDNAKKLYEEKYSRKIYKQKMTNLLEILK
jgi:glycosyltransferase involved in cell wall biosynthesis